MINKASFSKQQRLVKNEQFRAVLKHKRRRAQGLLVVYSAPNDCGYPRCGVSVGKACGNAVTRNRLKRVLREAFRKSQQEIPHNRDYLLMISSKWSKKQKEQGRNAHEARRVTVPLVQATFLNLVQRKKG